MKRAALLLFVSLAAACGPARSETVFPRYLVLTTVGPESPMYPHVRWLAARRHAEIVVFRDLEKERAALAARLGAGRPSYVAVFARPEELDLNFHLTFLEIACRVDEDPFPDFAFGYFPAADAALLDRHLRSLEAAEMRAEKRALQAAFVHFGSAPSAESLQHLEWANRLPLRLLEVQAGDAKFFDPRAQAIERSEILLLAGDGSPEGVHGFSARDAGRLKLDALAVFSGADETGVPGAVFELDGGRVRRRTVRPEHSFLLALLRSGVPAAFAPLRKTHPALVGEEWTHALLSDAPFGEVMKHTYDLAVLAAGGSSPSFDRLVEGQRPSAASATAAALAAARVLYGDPILHMFSRPTTPPVRPVPLDTAQPGQLRFRVASEECRPFFADPFTGGHKIHLRLPLPAGTRRASAALEGAWVGEQAHPLRIGAQAFEDWRDEAFLHVLLHGSDLARKDLVFQLRLALE